MSLVGYALRAAKQYYDPKTYDHALRVAAFVADNKTIPQERLDLCISLAIMHDLVEDTIYTLEMASRESNRLWVCLDLITKPNKMTYIEYLQRIKDNSDEYPEVYWVKLADIKDHLSQTETLTDRLKEKYLQGLSYLL